MKTILAGFLTGLVVALGLTMFAGENPLHVAGVLWNGAFGSAYDFGLSLFYATPLIFTGLSVIVAFEAGLFNIGAEGQLVMATAAAVGTGVFFPGLPAPIALPFALAAALVAGGAWGALAGWLRTARHAHEVIVTILLNFIASGLTGWFVLNVIPNPNSQNPESAIVGDGFRMNSWDPIAALFPDTGASFALVIAVFVAIAVWVLLNFTRWGFEVRASGDNDEAALRSGIPVDRRRIQAMFIAGALAGLVAVSEVFGKTGQFKIGFSPDYGFIGIAVALLARRHPIGVIFSAFLLGALHKGAADLDLETQTITRDFSKIMQALIILGVCTESAWRGLFARLKRTDP